MIICIDQRQELHLAVKFLRQLFTRLEVISKYGFAITGELNRNLNINAVLGHDPAAEVSISKRPFKPKKVVNQEKNLVFARTEHLQCTRNRESLADAVFIYISINKHLLSSHFSHQRLDYFKIRH